MLLTKDNFSITTYPDGQKTVFYREHRMTERQEAISLKFSIENFDSLELLIQMKDILDLKYPMSRKNLYAPYIWGLRSDRAFSTNEVSYVKSVVGKMINLMNFNSIYTLDPHSNVAENVINNLFALSNTKIIRALLENEESFSDPSGFCIIAPDDGASKKIFNNEFVLSLNCPIYVGNKRRNKEGSVIGVNLPKGFYEDIAIKTSNNKTYSVIVIDDLCDGGRTFIELANIIGNSLVKKFLVISHGLFSKGTMELEKAYEKIYVSNSLSNAVAANKMSSKIKLISV